MGVKGTYVTVVPRPCILMHPVTEPGFMHRRHHDALAAEQMARLYSCSAVHPQVMLSWGVLQDAYLAYCLSEQTGSAVMIFTRTCDGTRRCVGLIMFHTTRTLLWTQPACP